MLEVVDADPAGLVLTYGDVAELVGGRGARFVGNVMSRYGVGVPWWRVVRAGGWPPRGLEDRALRALPGRGDARWCAGTLEGLRVDLDRARWAGPRDRGRRDRADPVRLTSSLWRRGPRPVGEAWWDGGMVLLRRAPALVVDAPRLDAEQRACSSSDGPLVRVLGAPGTGKTTTAVELVVDRVARGGLAPDQCLLLTSTRVAAARLRERVTARLGAHVDRGRWPVPTRRSGSGSCARRPRCAATRRPGSSAGPSRTSCCASCSPATRGRGPRPRLARAPRARPRASGASGPSCATCSCGPSSTGSRPTPSPSSGAEHRPARVGRRGAGADASTTRSPPSPGPAPTTRPGSSPRRPTCSRTTPRRWPASPTRCGSSSSTTPRS